MKFIHLCLLACLFLLLAAPPDALAGRDLAKQSQNPIADLISVPLQNNFYFGVGPSKSIGYIGNLQPVIPTNLGKVNLINRFIIPLIWQEGQDADALPYDLDFGYESGSGPFQGSQFGLGDTTYQGFFSPVRPGKILWGIGPALVIPTNSDERFGVDKWSAGPAAVALTMPGKWVLGVLAQNVWSFAGDDNAGDVNKFLFQYFINYNLDDGWFISSTPIITANWEADGGNQWTVPFGGGAGRLIKIGKLPVTLSLLGYWNAVKPDFGPEWSAQFVIKFLFPK